MNVLVTGSSGWLGQTLVPRLVRDGHKVVVVDVDESDLRDRGMDDMLGIALHQTCRGDTALSTKQARLLGIGLLQIFDDGEAAVRTSDQALPSVRKEREGLVDPRAELDRRFATFEKKMARLATSRRD